MRHATVEHIFTWAVDVLRMVDRPLLRKERRGHSRNSIPHNSGMQGAYGCKRFGLMIFHCCWDDEQHQSAHFFRYSGMADGPGIVRNFHPQFINLGLSLAFSRPPRERQIAHTHTFSFSLRKILPTWHQPLRLVSLLTNGAGWSAHEQGRCPTTLA